MSVTEGGGSETWFTGKVAEPRRVSKQASRGTLVGPMKKKREMLPYKWETLLLLSVSTVL